MEQLFHLAARATSMRTCMSCNVHCVQIENVNYELDHVATRLLYTLHSMHIRKTCLVD